MDYLDFSADLQGKPAFADEIVTAQLAEIEFESFTFENREYHAYIQQDLYNEEIFNQTITYIQECIGQFSFSIVPIETKNWNAEWELSFEPVTVENSVIIRAPFHTVNQSYTYDIVIEPKMSFGTGHHETTFLVMQQMLQMSFDSKTVADCGCGTAVLGILASKMGAKSVYAFDYDPLCSENSDENAIKNSIKNMQVALGGLDLLADKKFDVLLANINRNILTHNMHYLSTALNQGGSIIMSGFYEKDIPIIKKSALENGLKFVSFNTKNNWSTTVFVK
mgnify:CR=1 FL=1